MEFRPQKSWYFRRWGKYSRSSGVSTFQYTYWYCDYTFCNLVFTEPIELLQWLPKKPK